MVNDRQRERSGQSNAGSRKRAGKVPCYCNNCNGKLVTEKTAKAHKRKSHRVHTAISGGQRQAGPPVPGPSRVRRRQESSDEDSSSEGSTEEGSSSEDEIMDDVREDVDGDPVQKSATLPSVDHTTQQFDNPVPVSRSPSPMVPGSDIRQDSIQNSPRHSPIHVTSSPSPLDDDAAPNEPDPDDSEDGQSEPDPSTRAASPSAADDLGAFIENRAAPAPGDWDPDADDNVPNPSRIEHVRISDDFISRIREATLDNDKLTEATLRTLRNPPTIPYTDLTPAERLSLALYIDCDGSSENAYSRVKRTVEEEVADRYPDGLLSIYRVRKLLERLTGIVSVEDDMCIKGCHAFTGEWANLDHCHVCGEARYLPRQKDTDKKISVQQMTTIPLGLQLQALRRSAAGSKAMTFRDEKVNRILQNIRDKIPMQYDDVFSGEDYLKLHNKLKLTSHDIVVGFSIDGAQLYQDKKSDCWIAIWIIYDYDPATRYKRKHVLPALIIPGPEKPKNLDSYLFRSFYHLSALQRENGGAGFKCWDHSTGTVINTRVVFLLATADAVGLVELDGRVGHHGAMGCRLGCLMKGRHKPGQGHYYAAHMKPTIPMNPQLGVASNHDDFDFKNIRRPTKAEYDAALERVRSSTTQDAYQKNRRDTGISKPSIISGLVPELTLEPPLCYSVDHMHHILNNLPDLLLSLWRGTIKCEPSDNKASWFWAVLQGVNWTNHGLDVAKAGQYLPSHFHRIPRNPALKISSSYKCTEYNIYFYKLGRVLFRKYLPPVVYQHYCLLVHAVDILMQRTITPEQVADAHKCLVQFVKGYEKLYYQGREDRLHFCRSAIHTLLHTSPEVHRIGPGAYATQYTLENIIGDLGGEIRQPSNPFGNMKKIALRRCQTNAAKVIYPHIDLDAEVKLPRGAWSLEPQSKHVLLRPRDPRVQALKNLGLPGRLVAEQFGMQHVQRWGRIMLPNRQHGRSLYVEERYTRLTRRVSRMLKLELRDGGERYAEALFYFGTKQGQAKAVVALFGPRNERIYQESKTTVWACTYPNQDNEDSLRIIDLEEIVTVVSMQPFVRRDDGSDNDLDGLDVWFVAEKSGLEDTHLYTSLEQLNQQLGDNS